MERKNGRHGSPDRGKASENIQFVKNAGSPMGAAGSAAKRDGGLSVKTGIIIIIILVLILVIGGSIIYPLVSMNSPQETYGNGSPYTGVLVINGEIGSSTESDDTYQHDWILDQIRTMKEDPENEGILLYVNSPGGGVFESDELYNELRKYQKKTRRPLYAYFDQEAASGGYYISASADKIIANKLCTTGSIGVYMGPVIDSSRLLSKLGVSVDFIKSGENKAMGNPFTPLTKEQKAIYQSQVDEYYERFAKIVSEGRDLSMEEVYEIGDGRSYTAAQALENGLIDKIGDYEKAKKIMKKDCGVGNFVVVQYEPEMSFLDYFMELNDTLKQYVEEQGKSETQKTMEYLSENGGHMFYYESFD